MENPEEGPMQDQEAEESRRTLENTIAYVRAALPEASEEVVQQRAAEVMSGIAWLRGQWGETKECPYCGNAGWTVGMPTTLLTVPLVPEQSQFSTLGALYPVVCTQCGNTALVFPHKSRESL